MRDCEIDRVVIFGPPGVGKSTISQALIQYGYYYFDGDAYSFPEAVALNKEGKSMTPELRDREYLYIFNQFKLKIEDYNHIVLDYHLMFDRYRVDLNNLIDGLRWIYLNAPFEAVKDRLDRPEHLLSNIEFAAEVFHKFEKPSFEVSVIDATLSKDEILKQILEY